jgi:hypothetical protein
MAQYEYFIIIVWPLKYRRHLYLISSLRFKTNIRLLSCVEYHLWYFFIGSSNKAVKDSLFTFWTQLHCCAITVWLRLICELVGSARTRNYLVSVLCSRKWKGDYQMRNQEHFYRTKARSCGVLCDLCGMELISTSRYLECQHRCNNCAEM